MIDSFTIGDGIKAEIDIVPSRGVLRRWYWMVRTLDAKVPYVASDTTFTRFDVFWHRRADGYAWTFRGAYRKAENVVCDIERAMEGDE